MILVLDDLRNSGVRLGHSPYGDGHDHGNGGGDSQYRGMLDKKGGGFGTGDNFRTVGGDGSSLVQRDGGGTVIRA
jgi:hypothetical protein